MTRGAALVFVAAACAAASASGCDGGDPGVEVCRDVRSGVVCRNLSSYGLFQEPLGGLVPAGGVPFAPNTPLFSDYTTKYRFLFLPPGGMARYADPEPLSLPEGTIVAKTFAYLLDARDQDPHRGQRLLETRLLINRPSGWDALPFVWNAEQTEATLREVGTTTDASWVDTDGQPRTNNYVVPNTNQCKECHENDAKVTNLIGITARQLNRDLAYASGTENQLAYWTRTGLLAGAPAPEAAPRLAAWDDDKSGTVEQRARAWLEANCAHCHNDAGMARTSGLELLASEMSPYRYGVCKSPVAAGKGSGGRRYGIAPGDPDSSVLVYRIESTEPKVMMPETGRRLPHKEGIALVRQWIKELQGDCSVK